MSLAAISFPTSTLMLVLREVIPALRSAFQKRAFQELLFLLFSHIGSWEFRERRRSLRRSLTAN